MEKKLFEIKHKITGKALFSLKTESLKLCAEEATKQGADLRDADLRGADLRGADLQDADLQGADLRGADLRFADLRDADLQSAYLRFADLRFADLQDADLRFADLQGVDLRDADLQGVDLRGAENISKYLTTPLYMLYDQIGKIRAYKVVNGKNEGMYQGGVVYETGKTVSVKKADCDETTECSYGISLATLDWCIRKWKWGYKILVVEFTAKDIAAIPIGSDGKFRVKKCKVIREKNLKKLGLTQ